MPNELRFEVEFTRDQIQDLLKDPAVQYLNVSGTYAHLGQNSWSTVAEVYGTDNKKERTATAAKAAPCIKPC